MFLDLLDNEIQLSTHTHSTKCLQYVVSDFLLSGKCACTLWVKGQGGGGLHQMFSRGVRHPIKKMEPIRSKKYFDLKLMKKGGKLDRKLIQNGKKLMQLDQLYVHVSLELNVIDTNWFFLQKEEVNRIWLHHTNWIDNHKNEGHHRVTLPRCLSMRVPPSPRYFIDTSWLHFLRYSWVNNIQSALNFFFF